MVLKFSWHNFFTLFVCGKAICTSGKIHFLKFLRFFKFHPYSRKLLVKSDFKVSIKKSGRGNFSCIKDFSHASVKKGLLVQEKSNF